MPTRRAPVQPGTDTELAPNAFPSYFSFLKAVRLTKGMRLTDVRLASAPAEFPQFMATLPALSHMEKGRTPEPTFRQMCKYSRGYGVPLAKLEYFFRDDGDLAARRYRRPKKKV